MCRYFLNISSTFEQYRDNNDNRDNFDHYNRDNKCSYRYIPSCYHSNKIGINKLYLPTAEETEAASKVEFRYIYTDSLMLFN